MYTGAAAVLGLIMWLGGAALAALGARRLSLLSALVLGLIASAATATEGGTWGDPFGGLEAIAAFIIAVPTSLIGLLIGRWLVGRRKSSPGDETLGF